MGWRPRPAGLLLPPAAGRAHLSGVGVRLGPVPPHHVRRGPHRRRGRNPDRHRATGPAGMRTGAAGTAAAQRDTGLHRGGSQTQYYVENGRRLPDRGWSEPDAVPRDARPAPQQCFDPVRGHRQLHAPLGAADRVRSGQNAERAVWAVRSDCTREPMSADKDSRRLLLLRVRTARVPAPPRCQLCQYGPPDDRSYKVRPRSDRLQRGHANRHPHRQCPVRRPWPAQVAV
uniref:(northern house mosquito) hypothetical protein n=1 Tax=Culex pipiens TaxID=7175 RepID=A0A8D8NEX8_CULPI